MNRLATAWVSLLADATASAENEVTTGDYLMLLVFGALSAPVWYLIVSRIRAGRAPLAYEGRRPVPWNGLDVIVVLLGILAVQLVLPALLLVARGVPLPADGQISRAFIAPFLAANSTAEICSLIGALFLLMNRVGADWEALGFDLSHWRRDVLIGLATYVAIFPPIGLLQWVLMTIWPSEHPLVSMVKTEPTAYWLAGFRAVLVAPLVEEFVLRVLFQGWLEKFERTHRRAGTWPLKWPTGVVPVVASAGFFALLHVGHGLDPIPLFVLAMVLGYLYRQTHRILPSVVVHTALNGLSFLMLGLQMSS